MNRHEKGESAYAPSPFFEPRLFLSVQAARSSPSFELAAAATEPTASTSLAASVAAASAASAASTSAVSSIASPALPPRRFLKPMRRSKFPSFDDAASDTAPFQIPGPHGVLGCLALFGSDDIFRIRCAIEPFQADEAFSRLADDCLRKTAIDEQRSGGGSRFLLGALASFHHRQAVDELRHRIRS